MTSITIIAVCLAVIVIGMVYLKIRDKALVKLVAEKELLESRAKAAREENFQLEKERIAAEEDLNVLYEKAEDVANKSKPDNVNDLINAFKLRKRKRNR